MTCVWKGLLQALSPEFKQRHGVSSPLSLVRFCQSIASEDLFERSGQPAVLHQGKPLSRKMIEESVEWIREYDASGIGNGHLMSTCDPFLLLLVAHCSCSIEHIYNKRHRVLYESPFNHARLWLVFQSDGGHFWFVKREHRNI